LTPRGIGMEIRGSVVEQMREDREIP